MDLNRRSFLATAATAAAVTMTSACAQNTATGKKYRACIIGDSAEGGYGHSMHLAFALQPDVEVVALADPDEAGRTKHAAEAGAPRTYADYREMLEKEQPNLVAVGPRTTTRHKEYVLACAEAGAHGFLEKPIAPDLAAADEMIAAVQAKNLKWAIAFNMRATPLVDHVKKLIWDEKLIGTVMEMRARGKEDNRAGGEDMIVLGTHLFDLMANLMNGMPQWCCADVTVNGKPAAPADVREATEPLGPIVGNRIHAMYAFDMGRAGYFDSMATPEGGGGRWGLDIYGSKGIIAIRTEVVPTAYWMDSPSWAPLGVADASWKTLPNAPEFAIGDQARERHKIIVNDLLAAIEQDRKPAVSLDDGRNSLEMIQAVWASTVQKNRVAIPLENRQHPLEGWS